MQPFTARTGGSKQQFAMNSHNKSKFKKAASGFWARCHDIQALNEETTNRKGWCALCQWNIVGIWYSTCVDVAIGQQRLTNRKVPDNILCIRCADKHTWSALLHILALLESGETEFCYFVMNPTTVQYIGTKRAISYCPFTSWALCLANDWNFVIYRPRQTWTLVQIIPRLYRLPHMLLLEWNQWHYGESSCATLIENWPHCYSITVYGLLRSWGIQDIAGFMPRGSQFKRSQVVYFSDFGAHLLKR